MAHGIHSRLGCALALIGASACSSEPSMPSDQAAAGASGAGSGGGGAGAGSGGGAVANAGGSSGSSGATAVPAGGAGGGAGGASGASGNPANTAGTNAAAGTGGGGAPALTECNGIQFPPRALPKAGPFQVGPQNGGLPEYWPTAGWKTETPDKLGFDPQKLEQALAFETDTSNTEAIFVVRHGYVAAEKYFGGFTS